MGNGHRINLGCGPLILPGYINIDAVQHEGVDYVFNLLELDQWIPENSVSEYHMRHVLEHFYPEDAMKVLRMMHATLMPNGFATIIVPNLEFHCKQLLGICSCDTVEDQRAHAFKSFFGWREPNRGGNEYDAHHWGFDETELRDFLIKAGFSLVQRMGGPQVRPHHLWMRGYKAKVVQAPAANSGGFVKSHVFEG